MTERINIERLKAWYSESGPEVERIWSWEVLALVDAVVAAQRVTQEREGHELGGESPLYVKLCTLDERLDRFEFGVVT